MLAGSLIVSVLFLLAMACVKSGVERPKPDPAHVAMVQQKQSAWLEKHPLLLQISRSQIAGLPGDLLTSACWHAIGAVTRHSHGGRTGRTLQSPAATVGTKKG